MILFCFQFHENDVSNHREQMFIWKVTSAVNSHDSHLKVLTACKSGLRIYIEDCQSNEYKASVEHKA